MVERARLTARFVDEIQPPVKGERWISDTVVKGFGLRLWATKSGGQKAFAVRTVGGDGKPVRKSFRRRDSWRYAFIERRALNLGALLEVARAWGRDEIDRTKGNPTIGEENGIRHRQAGRRVAKMPLGVAAHSLILGMRLNGRSQTYVDRVDKLFSNNIPAKLKAKSPSKVSPKDLAKALVKIEQPAGNIRILRSFVGQIFEKASSFEGPLGLFQEKFAVEFRDKWEKSYDVRYPELRKLTQNDFKLLFSNLEAEREYWQSALSIRLFFEFGAPLSRIFSAQWSQIVDGYWYPYWPDEKALWFESRERIGESAQALLERTESYIQRDFGSSRYWFPATSAHGAGHIRNVDSVWRRALRASNLSYYPLREFARSRREPNCPSYSLSFLRQYGEMFRKVGNAAELSKVLSQRKKTK